MEGEFKKLFSSITTLLNTPKKDIPFVSDNIVVEERVQEYIHLLINFMQRRHHKKNSQSKSNNAAPFEVKQN